MALEQHFRIFPSSGVPIYRQVMDQVRRLMLSGHLQVGDRLPSVRAVAAALEVNPMTISKAYSTLESEGVLKRVRGLGMQVLERPANEPSASRLARIAPVLAQMASEAHQLGMSRDELLVALDPFLDQLDSQLS